MFFRLILLQIGLTSIFYLTGCFSESKPTTQKQSGVPTIISNQIPEEPPKQSAQQSQQSQDGQNKKEEISLKEAMKK